MRRPRYLTHFFLCQHTVSDMLVHSTRICYRWKALSVVWDESSSAWVFPPRSSLRRQPISLPSPSLLPSLLSRFAARCLDWKRAFFSASEATHPTQPLHRHGTGRTNDLAWHGKSPGTAIQHPGKSCGRFSGFRLPLPLKRALRMHTFALFDMLFWYFFTFIESGALRCCRKEKDDLCLDRMCVLSLVRAQGRIRTLVNGVTHYDFEGKF